MVTCQSNELGWEVTVELPAEFLSLGRGSVITNQNRHFHSDLQNLDFNAGYLPLQPLFKYNDNHILVGYSRSFLSRFMSTRYPFT